MSRVVPIDVLAMGVTMRAGNACAPAWQKHSQKGFTFLAVLAAMFILAVSTQSVMTYVSQQLQRERETELLRIGQTYAQAIGAYYEATPGAIKRWPLRLEDLIEDRRQVAIKRHIREIYADPMTRQPDWVLVLASDGGITGVRSRSEVTPIRSGPQTLGQLTLVSASRYADWQFVYQPKSPRPLPLRMNEEVTKP
ncbi:MAG: hypothetical protein FD135_911 [Comamonadaceae bacterium]|nr:MAG: hypothetical protein FD135_911 [Comamonadaceae bacterium]